MALRAGIVGAGLMGRWHAHAATHVGARIAAVVDSDRARAETLAARHAGSRAFTDLDAALAQVDVVHVCTPTASHVALAGDVLRAGRHVLVEKPLAATLAETERLLAVAEASRLLLCPVHQFPFQDGARRVFACLAALKPIRHIDMTVCSAGADRSSTAAARDATALEILPHPLSLLVRLLPDTVGELEWVVQHPGPGEIRAVAQAQATTVNILISMGGRPTVNGMRLVGGGGTAHLDFFHGFSVIQGAAVSRGRKVMQPFAYGASSAAAAFTNLAHRAIRREGAYPGLRALCAAFYRAAEGGQGSPIPAPEVVDVARAYDRLAAAAMPRSGAEAESRLFHVSPIVDRG